MRAEPATPGGVNGFTDKSHAGISVEVLVLLLEGRKEEGEGMLSFWRMKIALTHFHRNRVKGCSDKLNSVVHHNRLVLTKGPSARLLLSQMCWRLRLRLRLRLHVLSLSSGNER